MNINENRTLFVGIFCIANRVVIQC
jgi:hypothetical protein